MTFFIWQGGISDRPVEISTAYFLDLQYSANNLHILFGKEAFLTCLLKFQQQAL